jgi:hypothetical protein
MAAMGRWPRRRRFSRHLTQRGDANRTLAVYRVLSELIHSRMHRELAIMIGRASQFIVRPSIVWWAKQARSAAGAFWVKLRALPEVYRRWKAAEALYWELSRLSDAELERRGIARGDLHRLLLEMTER